MNKCQFSAKDFSKIFVLIYERNGVIIKLECRVIMNFS